MPLKIAQMKYIPNKVKFTFFLLLSFSVFVNAQEIIKDSVLTVKNTATPSLQRLKVDGVVATVGDYIILDSDIDKGFLEIKSSGGSVKDVTRCQVLGSLLEQKLYAHQAVQDSIVVSDAEVKGMMDERLSYMLEQIGSMEKLVNYYQKDSEEEFRTYFFDVLKEQKLTSEMTKKIIEKVEITPEEVREFFKKIPAADLPVFGAELEVAQIVVKPKVTDEDKKRVIDKLNGFRKECLEEGASFATKAVLYSEDPSSSKNGGYYKMNRKTPFVKEFKDVAFSLAEGEISEPFETVYGFHIIYVEKIKGQEIELRHILISPVVSQESLKEAKEKITLIRKKILDKEISFAEAARTMSDEKETRANGGALVNPKTQDTRFELTKMDPSIYTQVSNLKDNEISMPFIEDVQGKKDYKIMTVTNRIDSHTADYAKDYTKIKDLALKEKQIKAIAKWFDAKIKDTYIKIVDEYRDCPFTNNWIKK